MLINISKTTDYSKPKIWFDGTVFCKNFSGERYSAAGILRILLQQFDVRVFVPNEFSSTVETWASSFGLSRDQIFVSPFHSRILLILRLLGLKAGLPALAENNYLWIPNHRVFPKIGRQFCLVHDMMPITAANYIPIFDRLLFRVSLRRIRHMNCTVFCHSHYVRKELIEIGGIPSENITVVPLGLPHLADQTIIVNRPERKNRVVEILFISAYQARKNFELLIDYVKRFHCETAINIRLTIAGPGLQERFRGLDRSDIRIFGHITEQEKLNLFAEADIYINPSAAEGFGITNLEAQLFGLPVLCSDIPPFREVLDDSAAYFHCQDYASFHNALHKIIFDREYTECLIKRGKLNAYDNKYENNLANILSPKVSSIINRNSIVND